MDERVLPSNDVTLRPPMLPERVIALGDQDVSKALGILRIVVWKVHFQVIHVLQVERDRPEFTVDLEHVMVLAPWRKPGGCSRSSRRGWACWVCS